MKWMKTTYNLNNEDDLKNEEDLKNEDDLKGQYGVMYL